MYLRICFVIVLTTLSLNLIGAGIKTEQVREWSDSLFTKSIENKRAAGVVVVYVKDGKIEFSKGYGTADMSKNIAMDPESSLFRIGSNSKTFVATGIAQLVDRGAISSIDESANKYLKRIKLPNNDGVEITLKHLLTHRAGFENEVFNIGTNVSYKLPLSKEVIDRYLPEYINPAGKFSSYNNYGTAVLGLIIEDVSGLALQEYFDLNIFRPLEMTSTYLNMDPDEPDGITVAYGFAPNGDPVKTPHRSVHPFHSPIGGINSTAHDMAKFMIAQLDEGRTSEHPIMSETAFQKLHKEIVTNHPLSSGFGMIFFTWDWNGTKMFLHGGNWPGSESGMVMFPESNSGLFFGILGGYPELPILEGILGSKRMEAKDDIVVKSPISNVGIISHFLQQTLGNFNPNISVPFEKSNLDNFIGYYQPQSAAFSSVERTLGLLQDGGVTVENGENESLIINGFHDYIEISPGVFWKRGYITPIDGYFVQSPIFNFVKDSDGNVEYLSTQVGFDAWVKVGASENPQTYLFIWMISILISLSSLIFIFYKPSGNSASLKWQPVLLMIILIAMPLVVMLGYDSGDSMLNHLFFGKTVRFTVFVIMANLVIILALFMLLSTVKEWKTKGWGNGFVATLKRVHHSLITLVALMLLPVFHFINALII